MSPADGANTQTTSPLPPILDAKDLLRAIDHDFALLQRMLTSFRKTLTQEFSRIEEALDRKDYDTLRDSAHKLEGMLGNFSTPASIEAVQRFHQAAKDADDELLGRFFEDLQHRTKELDHALQAQLDQS